MREIGDYRDRIVTFVHEHDDVFTESDRELLTDSALYLSERGDTYHPSGKAFREHLSCVFSLYATYVNQRHAKAMQRLTWALVLVAVLQVCVAVLTTLVQAGVIP